MNFQTLIGFAGYETRSYSGRAMYGKSCLGVTLVAFDSLGDLVADVLEAIDTTDESDQICCVVEAFRCMRMDSIGKETIVYFPDVEFSDDGAEDEDEVA